jgi:uncharacterized protein YbjQ (UPF0145 family)
MHRAALAAFTGLHDVADSWAWPDRRSPMDELMTTTAFTIEGYRIVESLGVVRGVTVRSRSLLGTIGAKFETLIGGHITMLTSLCERARADAFDILLAHAQRRGANAIVGVRYDATEIMSGVTEVLCYGTAVVVEPVPGYAEE